ncbi:class I SAM-dependent methyltransferase [Streptomyces sp. SID13726]|uniref:class I SAM-dependent methyltransferase n=1 Tax=Streptomyces sp. SID13726 TaxID=2706058 RepID=UPI0013BBA080|nr:class I SAM-dependent methyltransferase [Streptomyces sp. SID13726]NEA97626.1 class I SAM-dependent methyltransferase [Streptomyces sp. SID13726]
MTATESGAGHVALNRRYWDEQASAWHGPLARDHWRRTEPGWGLWNTPESRVRVFPDDIAGMDAVELGCGTAYVCARLARAGARPVGVDLSREQLDTARSMQREFGIAFPLVLADAERLPLRDAAFDLAVSEFGASLWCDPYRWIPEAARVLRPGGHLVFVRRSPLFALCAPGDGRAGPALLRAQFGMGRHGDGERAEFTVAHGEMLRLLRSYGFVVDDLIEIQAPESAHRDYPEVAAAWARSWPSEEIWKARLRP